MPKHTQPHADWLERVVERRGHAPAIPHSTLARVRPKAFLTAEHDALMNAVRYLSHTREAQEQATEIVELHKLSPRSLTVPKDFDPILAFQELKAQRDPSMLPSNPVNRALWALSRFAHLRSGYDLINLGANTGARVKVPRLVAGTTITIEAGAGFVRVTLPRGLWIRFIHMATRPWGLDGCPYWQADPTFAAPATLVPPSGSQVENTFFTAFHEGRGLPFTVTTHGNNTQLRIGPLENDPIAREQALACARGIVQSLSRMPWARRALGGTALKRLLANKCVEQVSLHANLVTISQDGVRIHLLAEEAAHFFCTATRAARSTADPSTIGRTPLFTHGLRLAVGIRVARGIDPRMPAIAAAVLLAQARNAAEAFLFLTSRDREAQGIGWRLEIGPCAYFGRTVPRQFTHCYSPSVVVRPEARHHEALELVFGPDGEPAYCGTSAAGTRIVAAQYWGPAFFALLAQPGLRDPSLHHLAEALEELHAATTTSPTATTPTTDHPAKGPL
ncbi:MAG: hypothetical protein HY696_08545 [Deltaproteobacteria bacterium]|nr:hypothetical protein [Deltaproteobacteria bacterium]